MQAREGAGFCLPLPRHTNAMQKHSSSTSAVPGCLPQARVPARSVTLTQVTEWENGSSRPVQDWLAAEEPLEIRIGDRPVTVTMRTPGHDSELAAGLLFTEGFLESPQDLLEIRQVPGEPPTRCNRLQANLAGAAQHHQERSLIASSGCGICGKASIEEVRRRGLRAPNPDFRIDPHVLCKLPDRLRAEQQVFGRTGGLHAAALFDSEGKLLVLREDIGRHNAVDKIVGWALFEKKLPLSHCVLMVSGRGGFEIAQKAIAAGVPVLASVSAPSSLAVQLARELDLTLAGFLRGQRFVVYSGEERIAAGAPHACPSAIQTSGAA
jgi:FdhD protein